MIKIKYKNKCDSMETRKSAVRLMYQWDGIGGPVL